MGILGRRCAASGAKISNVLRTHLAVVTAQADPNRIPGAAPIHAATGRLLGLVRGLLGPNWGGNSTGEAVRHIMCGDPEEEDGRARILGLVEGHTTAGTNDIAPQGKSIAPT